MSELVLFGAGSSLIVDVEESAKRASLSVRAAIRNVSGPSHASVATPVVEIEAVTPQLAALPFLIPLFTPGHRQRALRHATQSGFGSPTSLVDPTSILPGWIELGVGVYINAGCVVGAASVIGDFVMVNRGASIGHHARLEAFASIGPSAVLAGQVTICEGATVGAGATILPTLRIGRNAIVGAGAVVTKSVGDGELVVGNPARVVRTGQPGFGGESVDRH